ncbi:MAG: hypothetical protein ACE5E7_19170 [Anaerolineae bacterium]
MRSTKWYRRVTAVAWPFLLLVILVLLTLGALAMLAGGTTNLERISLGTGGAEANDSSFYVYLSADGRFAAFESYASNWAADGLPNFVDVFLRDRQTDMTIKVSHGYDGSNTDDDSIDPTLSADGRYLVFNSYATNLVPNDTNRDLWFRDGLDVFLYDRMTGQTQRVSLTWEGKQVDGNSFGTITPDGRYVVFSSNGPNMVQGENNAARYSSIYLRDWRTGAMERIAKAVDGGYPNGMLSNISASYDGRYIVYKGEASNLVANDTNGVSDIFLYDHQTGKTIRVSEPPGGGNANGLSGQPWITSDGQYIVFKSYATNLVPSDTNNQADIFVYTVATGEVRRVNLSAAGAQANGEGKDPSICDDGRFVSFTTDANNLVPGDTNGRRDVFLVDLARNEIWVATKNASGGWGNGRAHRSYLTPDCRLIGFASEASNLVANDANGARDIFLAEVIWPADFSQSNHSAPIRVTPGDVISYTFTIKNTGMETAVAVFTDTLPANVTFVIGSESGGLVYHAGQNSLDWQGSVAGESEVTFGFAVQTDPGATAFTLFYNEAVLTGDGRQYDLSSWTTMNGRVMYLPIAWAN